MFSTTLDKLSYVNDLDEQENWMTDPII